MKNELGDIRRSQIISTHGPGSIIDFRAGGYGGAGVSVVAAGLEQWDKWAQPAGLGHPQSVYEPRLQKKLGVEGFRLPPVAPQVAPGKYSNEAGRLVGVRFPQWLQCPRCHLLKQSRSWSEDPGDPALYCSECSVDAGGRNRIHVVPVRFVVACENGHLEEFPWDWWVRHKDGCSQSEATSRRQLKLEGSATAGMAGLILSCGKCGARRSLEGCFGPEAIPGQCHGRRPWLGTGNEEACSATQKVVQRGASNLYFSIVESALDIPPWSDALQKKLGLRWAMLENAPDRKARRDLIKALRLPDITGMHETELLASIEDRIARLQAPDRNIKWEEYHQFISHKQPFGENTEFEIRPAAAPRELANWLGNVTRATRLREVRANCGFTRILPPTPTDRGRHAKLSVKPLSWLPAIENRGEGIFIELNMPHLREWEVTECVQTRLRSIRDKHDRASQARGQTGAASEEVSARLLLVHSLSHALIRQLSLSCGYSSASLRERIYVGSDSWDMAGLLIFTSSPDADGTLGGLARQGLSDNIVRVLEDCMASMQWCSSDPLCIEGIHSLTEASSGAACHACLLAAETSCEMFNAFLDRALLVGTPDAPGLGFFNSYLESIRQG